MTDWEQIDKLRKAIAETERRFVGYNDQALRSPESPLGEMYDPRETLAGASGTSDGFLFGGTVYKSPGSTELA